MLRPREHWPEDGIKLSVITQEHTQEALSYAYVHAIAGGAGMNLGVKTVFDYGIDGFFQPIKNLGGMLIPSGFNIEFQMKASTRWAHEGENVVYDLDARAHRVLTDRERGQPFAILILLCLPEEPGEWLDGCEEHLRLRNCCYWYRPEGPPTSNVSSVRVRIPRANVLTPTSLRDIARLAREEAMA